MPRLNGFNDGLRPPPRLTPSQWADDKRILASAASAEPGKWRTSRTPYLREIMDAFDPRSPVQELVFAKGAQIGATECGFNIVGYYMDYSPCPIMYVMPTSDQAERNSKTRIEPMIQATPTLRDKIPRGRTKDGSNTVLLKSFPGGTLSISGANSATGLRSLPVRLMILDEVDGFPLDLDGEGSPVDLARARTRTFPNKKIFMLSTPTLDATSQIAAAYALTDQRRYFVPCPYCAGMQHLEWSNVVFDSKAATVREAKYRCKHCAKLIPESRKPFLLANGVWTSTAPDNVDPLRRGYHLNSLYSPLGWYSWADAANDFLKATRDEDDNKLKVFVNTVLGETWKEKTIAPPYEALLSRARDYGRGEVPPGVRLLTAGVDVQADRLEVSIYGWAEGYRQWLIDHIVIRGQTDISPVWDELAKRLDAPIPRQGGGSMHIARTAIDSGFNADSVYRFCRAADPQKVVAVKGQSGSTQSTLLKPPKQVGINKAGKPTGEAFLWHVGVDFAKSMLYSSLSVELRSDGTIPPRYCQFPVGMDEAFFLSLTAERMTLKRNPRGFVTYTWEKVRQRNEALDCAVYARAAVSMLGTDRWEDANWQAAERQYIALDNVQITVEQVLAADPTRTTTPPKTRPKKQRPVSSFW